jgi:PmbA protein
MSELVDREKLSAEAVRLVEAARAAGADAADAVALRSVNQVVTLRLGAVEGVQHAESEDFGLRVFVGRGHATISASTGADVAELAARAVAMAKVAPPDPYAGLADPARLSRDWPDLDLLDPAVPDTAALVERVRAAEEAGRSVEGVTNSGGASAYWSRTGIALATSDGFVGAYETSRHGHSVTMIAGTGTGMERDWEASGKIHLSDLEDPVSIGRKAAERAVRRLSPRQIDTRTATVVYDTRVASGLIGALTGAINGAAIARKTSFLKDKLGQRIFAPGIRITDDPRRPRGPASHPFDGEGLSPEPMDLVADGVLQTWILDSATGRELGLASNGRASRGLGAPGPSATNVRLHAGALSREALLRQVGTGLYVTDFIGSGSNLVTGDYSRGAAGFWIEDGELVYPVAEITVAGNLAEMFARLVPADDVDERGAFMAPTVAIEGLTLAGR